LVSPFIKPYIDVVAPILEPRGEVFSAIEGAVKSLGS
jgi:hypothetical protein